EGVVDVVVAVAGQAQLLEVVGALQPRGGLAHLLDGGQQEADEHGDDGDHHQQLDQREGGAASAEGRHGQSPAQVTGEKGNRTVTERKADAKGRARPAAYRRAALLAPLPSGGGGGLGEGGGPP